MSYQLTRNDFSRKPQPITDDQCFELLLRVTGHGWSEQNVKRSMVLKAKLDSDNRLDIGYGISIEVIK